MKLELSSKAAEDLSEIAFYTFMNFGERQMEAYRNQFKDDFQRILENPFLGREKRHLGKNIHQFKSGSHLIFYSVFADYIRIITILHGSRDIPKYFKS
ncbi:MAG: type II toxin-antitoxin system RelE/ParE family toxin [Nonlabens sp.]